MAQTIGELLVFYRNRTNLNREHVAPLMGCHPTTLWRMEKGQSARIRPQDVWSFVRAIRELGGHLSTEEEEELLQALQGGTQGAPEARVVPCRNPHHHWGEAPDAKDFHGRGAEVRRLRCWVERERCRLVGLFGFGGVGKTMLAAWVARQAQGGFDALLWLSLRDAPLPGEVVRQCLQRLAPEQPLLPGASLSEGLMSLLELFRARRCLLVLDNLESVMDAHRAGSYRAGYEGYGRLLRVVGECDHQSCVLLTSREVPKEFRLLEDPTAATRFQVLKGVGVQAGRNILRDKEVWGSKNVLDGLHTRYSGNPLALRLVAGLIRLDFYGDATTFVRQRTGIAGDVRDLLDEHFTRLTVQERDALLWLAVEREALPWGQLLANLLPPIPQSEGFEVLAQLQRRDLLVSTEAGYTVQNVVLEYLTEWLVEEVSREFLAGNLDSCHRFALMKAQAKEYIRQSQVRLLLEPVAARLRAALDSRAKEHLLGLLQDLPRSGLAAAGYAAGNILNLLVQLGSSLRGADFAGLTVRQGYLQDVTAQAVNFAGCDFQHCLFTDALGTICSVVFSTDGQLFATGSTNGEVRLWQTEGSKLLWRQVEHTDWVWSVAFSPDGRWLASGSNDFAVKLWRVEDGQVVRTLEGHTNTVIAVTFSPDGELLVSTSGDKSVRVWQAATGQLLQRLDQTNWVFSAAFSPDGSLLATGGNGEGAYLWAMPEGKSYRVLPHGGTVRTLAFSPDGGLLASGDSDQMLSLWNPRTGDLVHSWAESQAGIRKVAFSPDGQLLASAGAQGVRLWDVRSRTIRQTLVETGETHWALTFSPDGQVLATCGEALGVRFWDPQRGELLRSLQSYPQTAWAVAFSPDGQAVASSHENGGICLWDVADGHGIVSMADPMNRTWALGFSRDGSLLASAQEDGSVQLWDSRTLRHRHTWHEHSTRVRALAFSPDGSLLAAGGEDGTILVWNLATKAPYATLAVDAEWLTSIAFSPDGRTLANTHENHTVQLWTLATGSHDATLRGHTGPVWSVAFHPTEKLLASASSDSTLILWDFATHQPRASFEGHKGWIGSIAFSPDGDWLVSGGSDGTVRLWSVPLRECHAVLQGHEAWIFSVAFSPDGRTVASASEDGTVRVWNVAEGRCSHILRNPRPYEGMNIAGATGLTAAQRAALQALGAVEARLQSPAVLHA